jgi:hypothetical protein
MGFELQLDLMGEYNIYLSRVYILVLIEATHATGARMKNSHKSLMFL